MHVTPMDAHYTPGRWLVAVVLAGLLSVSFMVEGDLLAADRQEAKAAKKPYRTLSDRPSTLGRSFDNRVYPTRPDFSAPSRRDPSRQRGLDRDATPPQRLYTVPPVLPQNVPQR